MARDFRYCRGLTARRPPAWRHVVTCTPSWRRRHQDVVTPILALSVDSGSGTCLLSWRRRRLGAFRAHLSLAIVRDAVHRAALHSNLRTFGWLGGVRSRHWCLCRHGPCTLSVNCDAIVRPPTLAHPPAPPSAPGSRRTLGADGSSDLAPRRMSGWAAATCTRRGSRRRRDPAGPTPSPQAPAVVAWGPGRRKAPCSNRQRSGAARAAAEGFRQSDYSSCSSPLAARVWSRARGSPLPRRPLSASGRHVACEQALSKAHATTADA
jgi:hypothetical protein